MGFLRRCISCCRIRRARNLPQEPQRCPSPRSLAVAPGLQRTFGWGPVRHRPPPRNGTPAVSPFGAFPPFGLFGRMMSSSSTTSPPPTMPPPNDLLNLHGTVTGFQLPCKNCHRKGLQLNQPEKFRPYVYNATQVSEDVKSIYASFGSKPIATLPPVGTEIDISGQMTTTLMPTGAPPGFTEYGPRIVQY